MTHGEIGHSFMKMIQNLSIKKLCLASLLITALSACDRSVSKDPYYPTLKKFMDGVYYSDARLFYPTLYTVTELKWSDGSEEFTYDLNQSQARVLEFVSLNPHAEIIEAGPETFIKEERSGDRSIVTGRSYEKSFYFLDSTGQKIARIQMHHSKYYPQYTLKEKGMFILEGDFEVNSRSTYRVKKLEILIPTVLQSQNNYL